MYLCPEIQNGNIHAKHIMQKISSSAFIDTKPHYELLDGLRGVAALVVIWYHIFEGFATSPIDQRFNHGYLAVDFFFMLSGFVIGYAYDDRWQTTLTIKNFFKRRLIRLHPMVILGTVLGAITFYIQGCEKWDGTHVPLSMLMLAVLLNLFLIPAIPGTGPEVRGNGEMYPLNGIYPAHVHQSFKMACRRSRSRTCVVRFAKPFWLRPFGRRLDTCREQLAWRLPASDVRILYRIADVAQFQSKAGQGELLDLQRRHHCIAVHTAYRR